MLPTKRTALHHELKIVLPLTQRANTV